MVGLIKRLNNKEMKNTVLEQLEELTEEKITFKNRH